MRDYKKILEAFEKHLNEMPDEKLNEIIERIDSMGIEGPSVEEYFNSLSLSRLTVETSIDDHINRLNKNDFLKLRE